MIKMTKLEITARNQDNCADIGTIVWDGTRTESFIYKGETNLIEIEEDTKNIFFHVEGRKAWYDALLHNINKYSQKFPDGIIKLNVAFYRKQGYYNKIIMDDGYWFYRTSFNDIPAFTFETTPNNSLIFEETNYEWMMFDEWNGSIFDSHEIYPKPPYGWFDTKTPMINKYIYRDNR